MRYFETFAAPDAFDTLVVDVPALTTQQRGALALNVTSVLAGQIDNGFGQCIFVVALSQYATLYGSGLPQHTTGPALRHAQHELRVSNGSSSSFGA